MPLREGASAMWTGLAETFLRLEIVKFGQFRLKLHAADPGASLSPIYFDLRRLRSYPKLLETVANVYAKMVCKLEYAPDRLADVPTAATPITTLLSVKLDIPMISPRSLKNHGLQSKIDGVYEKSQVVVLVDDVVSRASSKLEIIKLLRNAGLVVRDVLVFIDREQGGAQKLEEVGCRLHSVFSISELLGFYLERGKISNEQYNRIKAYLAE